MITERLKPGLPLIFIGFNPSWTSHEHGFNYAGRNNRFYRVLHESGLTRTLYKPEESPRLLEDYGYGFTNIVMRPTARADEITPAEYAEGRVILREKLETYRPRIACYVGKGVFAEFSRRRQGVPWGFQKDSMVSGVLDFVAPSTSGLVRMKLAEQVAIFRELANFLHNKTGE